MIKTTYESPRLVAVEKKWGKTWKGRIIHEPVSDPSCRLSEGAGPPLLVPPKQKPPARGSTVERRSALTLPVSSLRFAAVSRPGRGQPKLTFTSSHRPALPHLASELLPRSPPLERGRGEPQKKMVNMTWRIPSEPPGAAF